MNNPVYCPTPQERIAVSSALRCIQLAQQSLDTVPEFAMADELRSALAALGEQMGEVKAVAEQGRSGVGHVSPVVRRLWDDSYRLHFAALLLNALAVLEYEDAMIALRFLIPATGAGTSAIAACRAGVDRGLRAEARGESV